LGAEPSWILAKAEEALRADGLLIFPTDTLYALGGLAMKTSVARQVGAAKRREAGKPFPVVAADLEQVRHICSLLPPEAQLLARRFWPGPLSLVLLAHPSVPEAVRGGGRTVAVRVPGFTFTRELCRLAGPLVATSANPSGADSPRTCEEAIAGVGAYARLAIDAGPRPGPPSTIVDLTFAPPRLVRRGAVSWEEIEAVLSSNAPC